ncbi:MAG: DUF58 domain-containing protein [Bacteroidia bacterium]
MFWRRLIYFSAFTVLRFELLLAIGLILLAYFTFNQELGPKANGGEVIYQWEWLKHVAKILLVTVSILILLSMLSAVGAWFWFLFRSRKGARPVLRFGNQESAQAQAGIVPVSLELTKVFRPFLGTIRGRLILSQFRRSESITLDASLRKKGSWWRTGISGQSPSWIWDRGAHEVEELQLHFIDMFHLISLPVSFDLGSRLWTAPPVGKPMAQTIFPNKTIEQTERTDTPKKVEGEYINYKDFEAGDDVRRIVWKIYARNRQLVVRVPETRDPYASHIFYYASFLESDGDLSSSIFGNEMLNRYKDEVRRIYDSLQTSGWAVKLPADQELPQNLEVPETDQVLYRISHAKWQRENTLADYVRVADAAFVSISGLVAVSEVQRLLEVLPEKVPIVLVELSKAIPKPIRWKFRNLFILPRRNPVSLLRTPWFVSPARVRLYNNEQAILRMLQMRGNAWSVQPDSTLFENAS